MRRWLQILAMVWMSAASLVRPAGAHPHEGADANGTAAQVSSIVCTLLPVVAGLAMQNEAGAVLGVGGVALGPSVGYFVGGHPVRGVQGGLGRMTLATLGFGLFAVALTQGLSYNNEEMALGAVIASGVVGAVIVGSAIYDIATVHATVDRHAARVPRYRLQGMRAPGSGAPALAVTTRF